MGVEFKSNFKYTNLGTIVGHVCYYKPLERKDGSQYGGEFLLNVQGHGSVNVRIPSMKKLEEILSEFSVDDRPHVRINMVQLDMFFSKTNKVYTNFTSFSNFKPAGEDVEDTCKGNVTGEVVKINEKDGKLAFLLAVFNTDKDGNQIKNYQGQTLPPKLIKIDVLDNALKAQFNKEVMVGTNLTVGYKYTNKNDVSYDEYGIPTGSGEKISRVEVGRLVVVANGKPEPKEEPTLPEDDIFGDGSNPFNFDLTDEDVPF